MQKYLAVSIKGVLALSDQCGCAGYSVGYAFGGLSGLD